MGGIIPPIFADLCIVMSSRKQNLRACRASFKRESPSRHHRLDTPVWLLLYWIDLEFCHSGFLRRRYLLSLRNSILDFLSVPSGSAWEVHVKNPINEYKQ